MKKKLPLSQRYLTSARFFSAALLLLVLLFTGNISQAQIWYTTSGATAATDAGDGIARINYDGSGYTLIKSSLAPTTVYTAIDYNGGRAFIYDNTSGTKQIKVVKMSDGSVTTTITVPDALTAIRYDAASGFIYYLTLGAGGGNSTIATDALRKVKPDGTNDQLVVSSIVATPKLLALDLPNNRVFVIDAFGATISLKRIVFGSSPTTATSTTLFTQSNAINGIDYNPADGYLYFIQTDGSYKTSTAADAVKKIDGNAAAGSTATVLASSMAYSATLFALDAGNDRAFFFEGATVADAPVKGQLKSVTLSTGAVSSTILNIASYSGISAITALNVPQVATLTTTAAASPTATSATLGGNISQSDVNVTERGIVYSSSNTTPVIGGTGVTKTAIGTGTGAFSQSITSLTTATTYYVRSYATSGAGTSYGSVVSFATLSNDATLSGLSLSSGSLNPTFAPATISYTASVPNSTTTIAITPTRNQANATIKVNLTIVSSGSASANFNLNVGDNAQNIVVTAQDGSTKTYTVTVNRAKAAQTITFAATASKIYGDADYVPGATSSSGLTVSYSSDNTNVATIVSGNIHIVGPGTANITASQAGDASNLAATNVVQALTVNAKAITVTATASTKTYGDADPSFTYSITTGALVGSDAFTGALTRDAGTNAGTYNITQGTLAISNTKYTLSFVSGVLTVNKRAISIQPAPASKSYGDVDPGYPYYYRVGSLASTDGMTGSFVRAPGETPGTYVLSIGTKYPVNSTTGVDQSSNYVITYIPEYLTITKRAITLQPAPATKVYGDADPGFPYYFRVGSLAPGEGMTGTFGRQTGEDAGVYTLNLGTKRPVNATSGVFTDQYYTISFLPEYLTITKKTLNVSANAQSKTYGDADPTLTYSAGSLPFSDTFSGTLTRIAGETTGTYAISQGSLALSNNYTLSFTGSNLTIGKKTINVSADAKSKTYGDADPALTYTADALVSGDSFNGALTRIAGESAGSYAINQGSLALNSNYTLAFTSNNLSIGPKTINVSADVKSKTYGDADPALTYTSDALLGGDAFTGALTRIGGEAAGNYAINQGSLTAGSNYALNFISNNLTIGQLALSYVATPASKIYLAPNPTFTGTVTGFINGDTQASATTGTLSFASTATDSSPQGNYPINGSGLSAANYSFVQSPANNTALSVVLSTDAALSNLSVSQGTLNTAFDPATYQYSVNVDHSSTSIDLTAMVHQPNATMLVNGMVLTSGSAITLPLAAGNNYFTTVVTAQDGSTTQSYLVTVNRAFSTNTLLTNITLSGVTINPAFDSYTTTYTAAVGNLIDGTDVTATAADVDAKAQVGPIIISATTPYHLTLAVGANPISVDGVAQNGDIKHYNINVTRAPSSDASLASLNTTVLTFNEPFSSTTYNYTATVANNVSQFNFAPVATNNAAAITFNGNPVTYYGVTPTINYGVNTYNIVVTSEDGTATHTYTITVTRTLSSDNNLATLSIPYVTTINEPFDPSVLNYTADLADSTITGLPLTAYSYDPNATMTINGTAVVRFANYTMTLHGGTNTFNIVVTPQDQSAAKTYTLVLTRAGVPPPLLSPDATLAAMSVSATGYSYNFNFAYDALKTLNVANKITAVRIHPVIAANGAVASVNGVALAYDASTNLLPLNVGDNTFDVLVVAADGVHQTTTTLHINRLPFADISLASLAIDAGTLTPSFAGTTLTYTASVPYSVSSLNVTPVANAAGQTVNIGATTIAAGTPSASVPLSYGIPNRIRVAVTAADGVNTQNYTVNVTRLAPDATLASLTLSSGALSPVFNGATTNYTASVSNSVNSIVITPTGIDPGAVITVNGTVASPSTTVPLSTGDNNIVVIVTAGDVNSSVATQTYSLTINRGAPVVVPTNNANLTSIGLGAVAVTRVGTTSGYTASVSATATDVQLTAVVSDNNATITVNGVAATSGSPLTVALNATGQTIITTVVKASNGTTTRTYTITIDKTGSSNAMLTQFYLQGVSVSRVGTTDNYTASVSTSLSNVQLIAVTSDANSKLLINGTTAATSGIASTVALNATGSTVLITLVTAENGTSTRTYTITVNKTGSSNAMLTQFYLQGISVSRVGTTDNYTASVSNSLSNVQLISVTSDANARLLINGTTAATSGIASTVALNATGSTVLTTLVTAENGTTTRTYTITVNKAGSSNAMLTQFYLQGISVNRVGTTDNYTASVSTSLSNVQLTAVTSDANAALLINGTTAATSGIASTVALNATGSTVLTTLVTAENGTTTRTYTITVNKTGSSNAMLTTLFMQNTTLNRVGTTDNYTASIGSTFTTVRQVAIAADANAIIKVQGVVVLSGVYTKPIPLNATGTTTITSVVTAQDGTTTRTYNVTISKLPPTTVPPTLAYSNSTKVYNINVPIPTFAPTTTNVSSPAYAGSRSIKNNTLSTPTGVATDAAGNIYVADIGTHGIYMIAAGTTTASLINNNFNTPFNIAADAAGNIYVADLGASSIQKILSTDHTSIVPVGTGLSLPTGVAVDAAGNLYVTCSGDKLVHKIDVNTNTTSALADYSFTNPYDVAVDASGNLFVADAGATSIFKIPVGGGTMLPFGSGLSGSTSLTVQANGSIYVATESFIKRVSAEGDSTEQIGSGFTGVFGIATDKTGNLITTDNSGGLVEATGVIGGYYITPLLPAGLTFSNSTGNINGTPTVVSPATDYLVTAYNNIGSSTATVNISVVDPSSLALHTIVNKENVTAIANKSNDLTAQGIVVHQAVSPNGDGVNDRFTIDGIENYTDNHLSIMNAGGALVYDVKGYGSNGNVFDGHSNKNGTMQKPGTYYYSLEYKDGNDTKRKTGYIILKY